MYKTPTNSLFQFSQRKLRGHLLKLQKPHHDVTVMEWPIETWIKCSQIGREQFQRHFHEEIFWIQVSILFPKV